MLKCKVEVCVCVSAYPATAPPLHQRVMPFLAGERKAQQSFVVWLVYLLQSLMPDAEGAQTILKIIRRGRYDRAIVWDEDTSSLVPSTVLFPLTGFTSRSQCRVSEPQTLPSGMSHT